MRVENWGRSLVCIVFIEGNVNSTYHVEDIVETSDPLHVLMTDTSNGKDGRAINRHTSDTDPFLHNLEPDDKLDTTTSVKFAGANAEEHLDV